MTFSTELSTKICIGCVEKMVKEKLNSVRCYDADGFRRRAACVCVRPDWRRDEVLLVSSSRGPDLWVVPGGGIEPDEDATLAAVREVREEAGVSGELVQLLGVFDNEEKRHRTSVYLFVVRQELDNWEDQLQVGRRRCWFAFNEAVNQLNRHKPVQISYLDAAIQKSFGSRRNGGSNGDSNSSKPLDGVLLTTTTTMLTTPRYFNHKLELTTTTTTVLPTANGDAAANFTAAAGDVAAVAAAAVECEFAHHSSNTSTSTEKPS